MSFPSALTRRQAGDTPEAALLYAMQHDTPLGFQALVAVAEASKNDEVDPVAYVRDQVPEIADDVLRFEHINDGRGLKVDFNPLAPVGMQIARLMGTDVARPLMEEHTGMSFGFANCCAPVTGRDKKDTDFTAEDQIRWQHSIDC